MEIQRIACYPFKKSFQKRWRETIAPEPMFSDEGEKKEHREKKNLVRAKSLIVIDNGAGKGGQLMF